MSKEIDERIVKMTLDNSGFEQPAKKSMTTLEKLKQAMLFSDATKGLESWQSKMDKLNMDKLMGACDTVTHRFSVFGIIADQTIRNITNKIESMASSMMRAATIEPVSDGFKEYELKMGSIQTIMAGTGESLQTVNKYLNELNTYSDKTIYSFSDMTNNIGKFTNAGVKLKDAVAAIQGVANVAAVSGANAGEASRAMYNFSQALSTGAVKLIDWKSIENANMATVEFKDTLLQCAVAMGTAEKSGDGMYKVLTTNAQGRTMDDIVTSTKNFNDSLQYQWMTTGVLTEALKIYSTDLSEMSEVEREAWRAGMLNKGYTDAQVDSFEELSKKAFASATEIKSFTMMIDTLKEALGSGWAMSWEIMLGDFEQAKNLWTTVGNSIGNVISKVDNARNDLLRASLGTGWEHMTGENFIGELTKSGEQIRASIPDLDEYKNRILAIAVAKNEVSTADADGASDSMKWNDLLHKGQISAESFSDALYDMRDSYKNMSEAEREQNGITEDMVQNLERYCRGVENGTISIEAFAGEMMQLSGRENIIQGILNIFDSMIKIATPIKEAFGEVFGVVDAFSIKLQTIRFRDFTEKLVPSKETLDGIKTVFLGLFTVIRLVTGAFTNFINGGLKLILPFLNLLDAVAGIFGRIISALAGTKSMGSFFKNINNGATDMKNTWYKAINVVVNAINKLADGIRKFPDSRIFKGMTDGIAKASARMQKFVKDIKELPVVQEIVSDFNNAYTSMMNYITPYTDKATEAVDGFMKSVKGLSVEDIGKALEKAYGRFKTFIKWVGEGGKSIINFFKNIKNGMKVSEAFQESFKPFIDKFKELKEHIEEFIEAVKENQKTSEGFNLDGMLKGIKNFLNSLTPAKVLAIALSATFAALAVNILKITGAMSDCITAFTGLFTSVKTVVLSYAKKSKNQFLQIAEAIAIITGSLILLSQVDPADLSRATKSMIAIGIILGALAVVINLAGAKFAKFDAVNVATNMYAASMTLIGISAAVLAMVGVIKALEKVNINVGIIPKLIALMAIMNMCTMFMITMEAIPRALDKIGLKGSGGKSMISGLITAVAVAGSLYLLSESMVKLSQVPTDGLASSVKNIALLLVAMSSIVLASSKVGLFSAVGLFTVVYTLTKLLPMFEKIIGYDYSNMESTMEKYHDVFNAMYKLFIASILLTSFIGEKFNKFSNGMLKISASLLILVGVAKLASMMSAGELKKGKTFIESCSVWITGMIGLLGLLGKLLMWGAESYEPLGKMFFGVGVAFLAMAGVAKICGTMDLPSLGKGILAAYAIGGLVSAMMIASSFAKSGEGDASFKSLAITIGLLAVALGEVVVLSLLPFEELARTIGLVSVIVLSLSQMLKSIPTYTSKGTTVALVSGMAFSLIAIGGLLAGMVILKKACNITPTEIQSVFASAALLVVALGGVSAVLNKVQSSIQGDHQGVTLKSLLPGFVLFAGVAIVMGAMSVLLNKLGSIDSSQLIGIAASISIVMPVLTLCMAGLTALGSFLSIDPAAIAGIAGIVGAGLVMLAGIGGILTLMSNFISDPSNLEPIISSIIKTTTFMLLALAGLMAEGAVMTLSGGLLFAGMLATLLAGIVMLGAVALGLNWLVQNAPGIAAAGPIINQIGNAINILIPALGALTAIGVGGVFSIAGIGSMIALLAALFAVCGVLSQFTQFTDSLQAGGDVLSLLAGVLGDALGSLVASFGEAATSGLPQIGQNLSDFGNNLQPFLDAMGKVEAKHIEAAQNLASIVSTLAGSSFLDTAEGLFTKIGNIFKSDEDDNSTWTEGITKTLTGFAEGIGGFATEIDKIDDTVLDKADIASQVLAKMVEASKTIGNSGGVFDKLFGSNDLDDFGAQIKSFGKSIVKFAEAVADDALTEDAVTKAGIVKKILNAMIEVADAIPNSGGAAGFWAGENDIDTFAGKLTDMIDSLCGENGFLYTVNLYADDLKAASGNISAVTSVLRNFISLANDIPNSTGLVNLFTGDNDLLDFTSKLPDVAVDITAFALNIKSVTDDTSTKAFQAKQALLKVVELAATIKEKKVSAGTVVNFMKDVDSFASSAYNLSVNLADFDSKSINHAMATVKHMINTFNAYSENGSNIQTIINSLDTLGKMSLSDFAQSILTYAPTISDNFNQIFEDMKTCMDEQKEAMLKMIPEFVKAVADTFATEFKSDANVGTIKTSINSMFTNVTSGLTDSIKKKFVDVGKAVVAGIKEGIEKNRQQAIDSMNKLIKETSKTNTSSGNKAPHKSASSNSASSNSAKTKAMNVGSALSSRVSAVINSDSASELTITPVMDTSSIDRRLSRLTARISNIGSYIPYANDISATARMKYSGASGYKEESTTAEANANGNGNNVTFVQNNYSPKALDELTVYRNTRRQVSQMKGLVTT